MENNYKIWKDLISSLEERENSRHVGADVKTVMEVIVQNEADDKLCDICDNVDFQGEASLKAFIPKKNRTKFLSIKTCDWSLFEIIRL